MQKILMGFCLVCLLVMCSSVYALSSDDRGDVPDSAFRGLRFGMTWDEVLAAEASTGLRDPYLAPYNPDEGWPLNMIRYDTHLGEYETELELTFDNAQLRLERMEYPDIPNIRGPLDPKERKRIYGEIYHAVSAPMLAELDSTRGRLINDTERRCLSFISSEVVWNLCCEGNYAPSLVCELAGPVPVESFETLYVDGAVLDKFKLGMTRQAFLEEAKAIGLPCEEGEWNGLFPYGMETKAALHGMDAYLVFRFEEASERLYCIDTSFWYQTCSQAREAMDRAVAIFERRFGVAPQHSAEYEDWLEFHTAHGVLRIRAELKQLEMWFEIEQ